MVAEKEKVKLWAPMLRRISDPEVWKKLAELDLTGKEDRSLNSGDKEGVG